MREALNMMGQAKVYEVKLLHLATTVEREREEVSTVIAVTVSVIVRSYFLWCSNGYILW